jgi:large subunit ribosomal protein L16
MKQYPKSIKFKKNHKVNNSFFFLNEQKNFFPRYGNFGLKAITAGKLNFKQIEACRKSLRRDVKKKGKISLRVFTNHSITKKSIGIRMGKGKGNHFMWICPIKQGQIICELGGIVSYNAKLALRTATFKLPMKTKILKLKY